MVISWLKSENHAYQAINFLVAQHKFQVSKKLIADHFTWLVMFLDDITNLLSAHIVFLIQATDQLLIGIAGWWVNRWDRTIEKAKTKLMPINRE